MPLAIYRVVLAFISSILVGIFINKITQYDNLKSNIIHKEEIKTSSTTVKSCCSSSVNDTNLKDNKYLTRTKSALHFGLVEVPNDLFKVLTTGFLLGGVLSAVLPDNFSSIYGKSFIKELLLLLVISLPLYICATSSIPLAQVFLEKGINPGAVIVFLMAGPASNVTTIMCAKKEFGTKGMLAYVLTISTVSILGGLFWNFVLSSQYSLNTEIQEHQHSGNIINTIFGVILILVMLNAARNKPQQC